MRLSYSTNNLVQSCPRKYQISKLQGEGEDQSNENNVHFDYGTALGWGLQCLMDTRNRDLAIAVALAHYHWNEEANKCFESIVLAILNFDLSSDWRPYIMPNGKPALELSFKLVLGTDPVTGEEDYYCGFMDAVLQNRYTKQLAVYEVKSTGLNLQDLSPLYGNSPQGLGYSLILGAIQADASFTVYYPVVQLIRSWKPRLKVYEFTKTLKDRLEWLIDIQLLYDQMCIYREMDYYPKHGQSCVQFNKACYLYGTCDLDAYTDSATYNKQKAEVEWDYVFHIDDLIKLTEEQLHGHTITKTEDISSRLSKLRT